MHIIAPVRIYCHAIRSIHSKRRVHWATVAMRIHQRHPWISPASARGFG
jgi:hypothetical protein